MALVISYAFHIIIIIIIIIIIFDVVMLGCSGLPAYLTM